MISTVKVVLDVRAAGVVLAKIDGVFILWMFVEFIHRVEEIGELYL